MLAQLQHELINKEEALETLQVTFQENQKEMPLSISTSITNTMTETISISLYSICIPQEKLVEFEMHTISIGSKILSKNGL